MVTHVNTHGEHVAHAADKLTLPQWPIVHTAVSFTSFATFPCLFTPAHELLGETKRKGSTAPISEADGMAIGRQSYDDVVTVVNKEERSRRRLQLAAGAAAVMIGAVALCAVVFSDSTVGVVSLQEVSASCACVNAALLVQCTHIAATRP